MYLYCLCLFCLQILTVTMPVQPKSWRPITVAYLQWNSVFCQLLSTDSHTVTVFEYNYHYLCDGRWWFEGSGMQYYSNGFASAQLSCYSRWTSTACSWLQQCIWQCLHGPGTFPCQICTSRLCEHAVPCLIQLHWFLYTIGSYTNFVLMTMDRHMTTAYTVLA